MYNGYVLKLGDSVVPTSYITAGGYKVVTDARLEASAERDADGALWRDVMPHKPSHLEVTFKPLNNNDMRLLMGVLHGALSVEAERKVQVNFYSPEFDEYRTELMYVPDFSPVPDIITEDDILYQELTLEFIGY